VVVDVPEPVQRRLDLGEQVLWYGQPRQGLFLRPIDAFLIPFSLLWGGLPTGAFVVAAVNGNALPMFPLLLFVIPGMYLIWGRFLVDMSVRRGLFYVVTDTRCVLIGTKWRKVTRTYGRGSTNVELVEHRNGRGTIRFVEGSVFSGRRNPWGDWFTSFEQIPDAPEVYRLARLRPSQDSVDSHAHRHSRPPGLQPPVT
jgi:hypothetical protein